MKMNKVKLGDICIEIGKYGIPASAVDFDEKLYRYLRITDIGDDGYLLDNDKKSLNDKEVEKYLLSKNDIVFARTGASTGRSFFYEERFGKLVYAGFLIRFKLDEKLVNPKFIKYYTVSQKYKKWIKNYQDGSTRGNMNANTFTNMEIELLDRKSQDLAVSILSSLDDKIELNNKINRELESLARTIYDYWFVQNASGKWEKKSLYDIATFTNGLACQKFRPKGNKFYKVIKIKEMREGFTKDTELVDANIPKNVIVNDGDILFSWSASLEVIIWADGIGGLNQHIFKVTSDKYPKSFIYFQLLNYLDHFRIIANNRRTTMGHITIDHLKQSEIYVPPKNIIERVDKIVSPIFSKFIKNRQESTNLAQLRDFLLPLLMNGEVRIENVGK